MTEVDDIPACAGVMPEDTPEWRDRLMAQAHDDLAPMPGTRVTLLFYDREAGLERCREAWSDEYAFAIAAELDKYGPAAKVVIAMRIPHEWEGQDVPASALEQLRQADALAGSPRCRDCGCTQNFACAAGCKWVAPDLCSLCHSTAIGPWFADIRRTITDRLTKGLLTDPKGTPRWRNVEARMDGAAWECAGLRVIWSLGKYDDNRVWLHVSYSRPDRMPSYSDSTRIKSLFIGDDKYAYTVLSASANHVNISEYCLHLWAPVDQRILPLPDFTRGSGSI